MPRSPSEPADTGDRFRAIVEAQAELVSLALPDGTLVYVNPAYARHFGLVPEQMIGRNLLDHVPEDDRPGVRRVIADVLSSGRSISTENRIVSQREGERWIAWTNGVQRNGSAVLLHSVGRDVTERARVEQSLRELTREAQRQSDILRLVAEAIPATVVVVGVDGRYRFANGAFASYCGRPREQIIGRTAVEVLGEHEVARRRPYMLRALAGESVSFALDYAGADGTTWLELSCIPLRLSGGEIDGFVGVSQDITRQRREQNRLTELTQRDPLTGLLNRAGFELFLERRLEEGRGAGLGLLYIDLDRFKPVNDRHGHPVGDRLLQTVAQRLGSLVRPTDAVARLGGDEFAIALVDVGLLANAVFVAEKVVAAIAEPFDADGLALAIGTSVGVAFDASSAGGWRELIQRADAMLYRAKESGRGRHAS